MATQGRPTKPMRVTCLLPAYNEAPRIGAVLDIAMRHPLIHEVIVIDDGSSDATANVAAQKGATLILMPQNGGKSRAIAAGVASAAGDTLLLLDSDLIGLTLHDLTRLMAPVLDGRADTAISLRRNAPRLWRWIGLDYISGERVLPKAMLSTHLDRLQKMPRFGVEVFMNTLWIDSCSSIAVVQWEGVESPSKSSKQGVWRGLRSDIAMLRDILRTVGTRRIIRQIRQMRAMQVSL